ncbi:hypothetical protein BH23CHL5_BH23CHL5_03370 [soil metagenome]
MAQRAFTAHRIVMFMRIGKSVETSVRTALLDLGALDDPFASEMNVDCVDATGSRVQVQRLKASLCLSERGNDRVRRN